MCTCQQGLHGKSNNEMYFFPCSSKIFWLEVFTAAVQGRTSITSARPFRIILYLWHWNKSVESTFLQSFQLEELLLESCLAWNLENRRTTTSHVCHVVAPKCLLKMSNSVAHVLESLSPCCCSQFFVFYLASLSLTQRMMPVLVPYWAQARIGVEKQQKQTRSPKRLVLWKFPVT